MFGNDERRRIIWKAPYSWRCGLVLNWNDRFALRLAQDMLRNWEHYLPWQGVQDLEPRGALEAEFWFSHPHYASWDAAPRSPQPHDDNHVFAGQGHNSSNPDAVR